MLVNKLLHFTRYPLAFVLFIFSTQPVFAQDYAQLGDLENVFKTAITSLAVIGGFLAFLALIFGGFKYITARGDPKAVASAQSTLFWALIGFVLIIVAWLILVFISNFTGVNVTIFEIPTL